jgi:antitoxin FitA
MGGTLTIRNLADPVKQKLRMQAASHGRSMEAEARVILATSLGLADGVTDPDALRVERRRHIESVAGIWEESIAAKSTDEIMRELRGDD